MTQKLWEKSVQVNKDIERFTVGRDREMDLYLAKHDVLGSMAHITMLESIGLLTKEELEQLLAELKSIYVSAERGEFIIEDGVEDVHSQVELMLTRRLGDIGKKIHSGRSRNDQVLLDLKLFTRTQIKEVAEAVEKLKEEQLDLKNQVSALKQKLLAYQAKEIDVTPELVKVFDSELSGNEPRELMNLLLERGAKICAIFAGNDEEGYRYVIGSHSEDVRVISKKLNEAFQGRGGGKPQMVQGSLKGTAKNISEIL